MVDGPPRVGASARPQPVSNRLLGYRELGRFTLPQFQEYVASSLVAFEREYDAATAATLQTGLEWSFQSHPPSERDINEFATFLCQPFNDGETIPDSTVEIFTALMQPTVELLLERYENNFSSNLLKPSGALRLIIESNPGMLSDTYPSLILTAAGRKDLEDLSFILQIIKALSPRSLREVSLPDTVFSDALDFAKGATNYAEIEQVISDIKAEFSK